MTSSTTKIRGREAIKIRVVINEIANRKTEKINKTKSWAFGETDKFDKPLPRLTKKKRRFKYFRRYIISKFTNIIMREYYNSIPMN